MKMLADVCWAVVPARGGSKSVPLKNVAPLGGRPLIDYVLAAAERCDGLGRVIVSTDHDRIADHCRTRKVEVHTRPEALAGDDTPVFAVLTQLVNDLAGREGACAEYLALLQPTSPFVLPEHITAAVALLRDDPAAGSVQTVIECPHNSHAYNQRLVEDGTVRFRFAAERRRAFNKQQKPRHWLFGNIVVVRVGALLEQQSPFPTPSRALPIDRVYGFDADTREDFAIGEALLAAGAVRLPHIS